MINKHDKPIFSKNTFVEVIDLIKKQDEQTPNMNPNIRMIRIKSEK